MSETAREFGRRVGRRFVDGVAAGVFGETTAEYVDRILAGHRAQAADDHPDRRWEREYSYGFLAAVEVAR